MTVWQWVLGIIDIVLCVALVVVVLFQHGKSAGLSGTISGSAETFFGKNKGRRIDAVLSKLTGILAFLFVAVSVILAGVSMLS
ncbi:MAG: preprotein translocase subunit SecG [Ruminococcaceae bacterium]|nr:preprotein translocase subunit SecG [Oscillospiraceae bacterium]